MSRIQSFALLLRPVAAPRAVACQQQFRFSTATRMHADGSSPRPKNPSLPPNTPSTPKEAQRAAHLATAEATTESDSAQPPQPPTPTLLPRQKTPAKTPSNPLPFSDDFPPKSSSKSYSKSSSSRPTQPQPIPRTRPKYHVERSKTRNLPIYTDFKRGGNLHITMIRKVTGDLFALRDELRVVLCKKDEDVTINPLTSHIVIKGSHKAQVHEFLTARGM
ncbi:hypothetical protein J1614_001838 [Plenodomus biglobosus]|nr:hypothetical protein J1614_001838 [Plenodomus biglobosus]